MVAARCRALTIAARWNGHAPQTATGEASASEAHCQFRNCSAGTIASATTGIASASDTSSRCRSESPSSAPPSPAAGPAGSSCRGAGKVAVYPARSTAEISSSGSIAAGKVTCAVSVAKLTVAATPASLLSFFSIRAAHDAHVIPPIASSAARTAPPGAAAGFSPVTVPTLASLLPRPLTRPGPFGS